MQKKIVRAALVLTLVTALLVGMLSVVVSYRQSEEQLKKQLWQEVSLLSSLLDEAQDQQDALFILRGLNIPNRMTWLAEDGTVLFDNQSSAATMENHADRPEIIQAREQKGTGYAKRFSNTLLNEQIYCARWLSDGGYLRLAATQRSMMGSLWHMGWVLVLGIAVVLVISAAFSGWWTRALVRPINELNLEDPLSNRVYEELSPMLRRMAEQNRHLDEQVNEIMARRSQLETIIEHMNEGLLVLDNHRHVLLMNNTARSILHTSREADGSTLISMYNRSQTLLETVETAMREGSARAEMQAAGREYQLTAGVVQKDEGLVLLIQDVTERNLSEQARKRFTANVSHELRTPLTAISGYAELLSNGMTQPEDVPAFAAKIRSESSRLLQLIEDIMHLSKLDEGFSAGRMERVDLLEAARDAADETMETARKRGVTLTVEGESVIIDADPTLLDEMLRNVIENGVKYNRPDGSVDVRVSVEDGRAVVRVKDTGIGIPEEHIDKVFERFYRVDGSRSKQTGGTGLGLSIVKHGAE
ncbi:MAG: ATP-binding protein, partial [bacterium]|nr:ATP-binding protein [bacterium]